MQIIHTLRFTCNFCRLLPGKNRVEEKITGQNVQLTTFFYEGFKTWGTRAEKEANQTTGYPKFRTILCMCKFRATRSETLSNTISAKEARNVYSVFPTVIFLKKD